MARGPGVRVLILYSHSLLAEGVESLLQRERLEVTGMNVNAPGAMERVRCLEPDDVVIFDTSEASLHPCLNVPQVFSENPYVVVIGLHSQDNKVEIYRKQEKAIGKLGDLVEVISML